MSDNSKRTRSQLILSEEFGDVHFGVSPLRAAKQERRRILQTDLPAGFSDAPTPSNVGVGGEESDDELLLSPSKTRPPKRQSLSQPPGFPPEADHERQCKRLKQDHNGEQSHFAVAETKQPNGPFDFSAINLKPLLSCTSPGQVGASSKQRAHTVPLLSPVIRRRDLGQLMPSPEKASIVPHPHEVLRFSSLPRSLESFTDAMNADNNANSIEASGRDKSPEGPRTPPPKELDSSSPFEAPTTEVESTPTPNSEHPSVTPGLGVMTFSFTQLPSMALRISPEGPDNDVTPKPINPPSTSSLDVEPIPLVLDAPSSLPDDPPSPLSTLSSMSELDPSPPPHESEIQTPNVELPSGIPRAIQPPSFAPLRDTTKSSGFVLSQTARLTTTSSRGRGGRGFVRPSGSARLTRSAAIKKQKESVYVDIDDKLQGVPPGSSIPSSVPAKRPSDSPALAPDFSKKKSSSVAVSHKRAFSFAMPTSSSLNKTTEKAPASSPLKPSSLSKPKLPLSIKPASSLGPGEPSYPSKHTGLSNLSLALEKLKIPPPSRPATTLGFNSDTRFVSNVLDTKSTPKAKDDSTIRLGHGLPSSSKATAAPLRRAVTVGSVASSDSNAHASGSGPATLIAPRSAHPTDAGPTVKKINLHSGVIVGKNSFSRPSGFVYGGVGKKRPFEKVSKKSSLPVVEGSPVKACGSVQTLDSDEPPLPSTTEIRAATLSSRKDDNDQEEAPAVSAAVEPMNLQDVIAEHVSVLGFDKSSAEDGQAEPADMWKDASRRASLASQFLQQTLAVLPSTPPPAKASGSKLKSTERSQSSSQRTRSGLRSGSNSDVVSSRNAPRTLPKGPVVSAHVSKSNSATATSSSLKVLKSCTIFVDVRTDDGDDAGGLFVDMLKGLGAKIIGRAGQSCTHIVYKNGLMSTLTKYRLMRDPKPFVVGISWVVECAEKCRRVGEENFLVDLEGLNVAGNNKRRRSMLPKHISSSIQAHATALPSLPGSSLNGMLASDQSMDGSSVGADRLLNSSDGPAEDEDDLPPLERARQRRNIFFRP